MALHADGSLLRESLYPMVEISSAIDCVVAAAEPLEPMTTTPGASLGLRLSEPVVAMVNLPPFRASVVDGYAAKSENLPASLAIQGSVAAGDAAMGGLRAGHCVYITTGAPVPDGADCVVMVEDSSADDSVDGASSVLLKTSPEAGSMVRSVGSDINLGQTILSDGEIVGPAELGLLAAAGVSAVSVFRRPRVGVFSTGHELAVAPGTLPSANKATAVAVLASSGSSLGSPLPTAGDRRAMMPGASPPAPPRPQDASA